MTPRRVRVLHVVQSLNFGGMERMIAEIMRRADSSRFELHLLALGYLGHFSKGLDAYATLHVMPTPATLREHVSARLSMLRPGTIARRIRGIAPDIIHTHSGVWYKAGLAAHMAGVPIAVHTDHGRQNPDPWLFRTVDGMASRRTDAVIAVSAALGTRLTPIVAHPERIHVIPNGVDTVRYFPAPAQGTLHRALGLEPGVPIIGSVGRLEVVKGYEVLVDALAHLRREWPDNAGPPPVLVLIGDGSERSALEAQAASLQLNDAVFFLGWQDGIEETLHEFTVFSMSSHSEGTSVSLLEAMSAGRAPVVTDVGGNSAVLGDTLAHRLVPPANAPAMAAMLRDILTDPTARARDEAAARARVEDAYGLDAMVREYESLYDTLRLARNANRPTPTARTT